MSLFFLVFISTRKPQCENPVNLHRQFLGNMSLLVDELFRGFHEPKRSRIRPIFSSFREPYFLITLESHNEREKEAPARTKRLTD
jgi:hypothetical protein